MSQRSEWRKFVERRRAELHDDYPCAMPTRRRACPKHRRRIVEICKPCRDELYEQLAAEYTEPKGDRHEAEPVPRTERSAASEGPAETPRSENDRPLQARFRGRKPKLIAGQLELDTTTNTDPREERSMTEATDLVAYEPANNDPPAAPPTLFGTSDPRLALERMADVATVLVDVIRDRKLIVSISGREHLTAEAWTTLGGMLGVVPIITWTRPLEDGSGWEARAEARTLDGRIVGAAESMCTRTEQHWRGRDEYALRSMAQTRAISRALRAPLGQIVRIAGYDPTSAEEIPAQPAASRSGPERDDKGRLPAVKPTPEQAQRIRGLLGQLATQNPEVDWPAAARDLAGVPGDLLTHAGAESLIEKLEQTAQLAHPADEPD
jgi:hypothetical protein